MSFINLDKNPEINIDKNGNKILKSVNAENNCTNFKNFKNKDFVIDESTKFLNDQCFNEGELKQNNNVNDYMLSNYSNCDCKLDDVMEISNKNPGITIKDGYDVSNCNIDDSSKLRQPAFERHYKSRQQLFPRPFLTSPYIIKGEPKPDLESRIQASIQSFKHKQMQNYDQNYVFTPLNEALLMNVQNTDHIIPEQVRNDWVRGGRPSRQDIKDNDYFNRSTDNNVVKDLLSKRKPWLVSP